MTVTSNKRAAGATAGPAKPPRRSAAQWSAIVADWKRSRTTAREYAQVHGLIAGTLLWWSSQGRRLTRASGAAQTSTLAPTVASPAFLPLHVTGAADPSTGTESPRLRAEVLLGGGRRVRLRGALTLAEFVQLLNAIEGGAAC